MMRLSRRQKMPLAPDRRMNPGSLSVGDSTFRPRTSNPLSGTLSVCEPSDRIPGTPSTPRIQ
jgi:hypothetical protein